MNTQSIKKITKRVLTQAEADQTKALRRVVVCRDHDPTSPREWDNVFTIHSGSRYLASDEGAMNPVVDYGDSPTDATFTDGVFALPIYAYVHSGMALSLTPFNDPWDSGCAGFMYVNKAAFCKEFGLKRFSKKRAIEIAKGEIATLQQYIDGDVYGWEEQTRETVDDEWETVNNCWGYFGRVGDMLAETSATEKGVVVCTEDPYEYDEYEVTMEIAEPSKGDTKGDKKAA